MLRPLSVLSTRREVMEVCGVPTLLGFAHKRMCRVRLTHLDGQPERPRPVHHGSSGQVAPTNDERDRAAFTTGHRLPPLKWMTERLGQVRNLSANMPASVLTDFSLFQGPNELTIGSRPLEGRTSNPSAGTTLGVWTVPARSVEHCTGLANVSRRPEAQP